jgi:hypothetical protein
MAGEIGVIEIRLGRLGRPHMHVNRHRSWISDDLNEGVGRNLAIRGGPDAWQASGGKLADAAPLSGR